MTKHYHYPIRIEDMLIKNRKVQYVIGAVLIACIIFKIFPLYRAAPPQRTYADFEQSLCKNDIQTRNLWNRKQCPDQGIITVMEGGRLGNQMWAYVTVWAYARTGKLKPYLPKCVKDQMALMFDQLTIPDFEGISHCPVKFEEQYVNKSNLYWSFTNKSIIIIPKFYRNPTLLLRWLDDILPEFRFNKKLTENAQKILTGFVRNLPAKSYTFIAVHVRRTDYIGYIARIYGDSAASRQFYVKAMKYYENKFPNCLFIFISDDPTWCYQEFGNRENVYVTSYGTEKLNSPAEDMAVMAACNHTIIDYGTFGEWGSILAGGETVYCNLKVNDYKGLAKWKNWTKMDN
ncbi:unnamed protein product [Ceutorhynchus assimilis]|uniref:L-Fucosyltransferase n=1 Tax=Ceutorhynchus assimilis TaxID=467358 RepID=A0A9N9MTA3_9CUCU|nr:unnamed protein product [Ceutorhynchus assimilis]